MKKSTEITRTQVEKRLQQVSYENQHGLLLCKRRQACPHCGKVTVTHFVLCPAFDLRLHVTKEHYDHLLSNEFEHWPVETMMEEFEEGRMLLSKGELHFWKEYSVGLSTPESIISVSKPCGKEVIELFLDGNKFKDLQDILDYKLENFYSDFNSGNHRIEIRA